MGLVVWRVEAFLGLVVWRVETFLGLVVWRKEAFFKLVRKEAFLGLVLWRKEAFFGLVVWRKEAFFKLVRKEAFLGLVLWRKEAFFGLVVWRKGAFLGLVVWRKGNILGRMEDGRILGTGRMEMTGPHVAMNRMTITNSSKKKNPEETKEILRREELIKTTKKILQQHCSGAVRQHHRGESVLKSLKRPRRDRLKTSRTRWNRKTASKLAKVRDAKLDDKSSSINIEKLRYSQAGCSNVFQCGRTIRELVLDLLSGKVKLSAPFLRLTVFETTDEMTRQRIFRCIDNCRLLALQTYATYTVEKPA